MKIAMGFHAVHRRTTDYGGTEGLVSRGHDGALFATGYSHTAADLRCLYPRAVWPPNVMPDLPRRGPASHTQVIHHGLNPENYQWRQDADEYVAFMGRFAAHPTDLTPGRAAYVPSSGRGGGWQRTCKVPSPTFSPERRR